MAASPVLSPRALSQARLVCIEVSDGSVVELTMRDDLIRSVPLFKRWLGTDFGKKFVNGFTCDTDKVTLHRYFSWKMIRLLGKRPSGRRERMDYDNRRRRLYENVNPMMPLCEYDKLLRLSDFFCDDNFNYPYDLEKRTTQDDILDVMYGDLTLHPRLVEHITQCFNNLLSLTDEQEEYLGLYPDDKMVISLYFFCLNNKSTVNLIETMDKYKLLDYEKIGRYKVWEDTR